MEEFAVKGDLAHLREMYTKYPGILNYKSAGETALHHAVRKGYVDVVEDLLEQGALVSISNSAKKSPIDIATELLEKDKNNKVTKIRELLYKYGNQRAFILLSLLTLFSGCGPDVVDYCYAGKDEKLDVLLGKSIINKTKNNKESTVDSGRHSSWVQY